MKRIYDFYRCPPMVGQRIVLLPVGEGDYAWHALDEGEPVPPDTDQLQMYDGHHARELDPATRVEDIQRQILALEDELTRARAALERSHA